MTQAMTQGTLTAWNVAAFLMVQRWWDSLAESARARGARADRSFDALWIPIVIVMAGAAAMTIWCNIRGYSGWKFELTWRGFQARCV